MSFVETIRVEDGKFHLLALHQQRMAATITEVYGADTPIPSLAESLAEGVIIPGNGLYKCRVVYERDINKIELLPYTPREIRSLHIVGSTPDLDYHLKGTDRTALAALYAKRGECDDVIIVRNGKITDSSFSNLIFRTSEGWLTPANPLLKGVMRRHLIESGELKETPLTLRDILPGNAKGIIGVSLINAMLPPGRIPIIPLSHIK